jgi:hypothetical protein
MAQKYRDEELHHLFAPMDKALKQADLAAIGAVLSNVPFPFSNLGVIHPAFIPANDLDEAIKLMRENVE